tara:strand:- start:234 stop:530 length:297 start_codon:yes stop_codon:yes gene_type:complete
MLQVRIHGRGGQGVVSAAEMLSVSAFLEGKHAQAVPSFGSERMGDGDFALAFGLGLEYGGFTLDIDLNPGFFTNPVNHITGNNLLSPLASQATITYSW